MAVYGRLPVYTGTILLATLFEIGCALAPNLPALIVLRLFAGFFSAAPLSNAGGSLNDIGNPVFRTLGLPLFTTTGFVGPILGPIIGSYIAESHLGWRWCYWITAIWNGFSFLLVVFCMPETLPGSLLKYKAMAWRSLSTNTHGSGGEEKVVRWKAEIEDESFGVALQRNLKRPFIMLVKEPILVFFSVYLTGESSIPLFLSLPLFLFPSF
jgi:DHA1 family multidrug resistance protein-like MFS transporter